MNERLLVRVEEAGEMLGLGRSKAYELVSKGKLPSIRIGSARRVPVEAIRRWVEEQMATQNQ